MYRCPIIRLVTIQESIAYDSYVYSIIRDSSNRNETRKEIKVESD